MRSPAQVTIASISRLRRRPTWPFSKRRMSGSASLVVIPSRAVADHEPPARRENARHLVDRGLRVGEVVQCGSADERREACVLEWQRVAGRLHELDVPEVVGAVGGAQTCPGELQHPVREVDPDGPLDVRRDLDDKRSRPAGDVEQPVFGPWRKLGKRLSLERGQDA